jgi:hypothetical protein
MEYYHFNIEDSHDFSKKKIQKEADKIIKEELFHRKSDQEYDFIITRIKTTKEKTIYYFLAILI